MFCHFAPLWVVECHTPFACGMYIHYIRMTCVCTSICMSLPFASTYANTCTNTHAHTLTSRVEGQARSGSCVTNWVLCYSNILIGAYGHGTETVPSVEHVLTLQITCHAILFVPHQSIPPSFSMCVRRCDMPKPLLIGHVMFNLCPSFYPFFHPCWN